MEKGKLGFERPQVAQDEWTARQFGRYGLGTTPSLEEIEGTAKELLSDPLTALAGAELVLCRRIDADLQKEPEVLPIALTPGLSSGQRFGLLLMQKDIETLQARKTQGNI